MRVAIRALSAAVVLCVASSSVQAGAFLKGARIVKKDPAEVLVKYGIAPCVGTDGSSMGSPPGAYWLVNDKAGLALFERDNTGSGALITNHWTVGDEDHFFTWVPGISGWEYVIPADRTKEGARLVFPRGSFKLDKSTKGIFKPKGTPVAKCPLTPAPK